MLMVEHYQVDVEQGDEQLGLEVVQSEPKKQFFTTFFFYYYYLIFCLPHSH